MDENIAPERIFERTLTAWVYRGGEAVAACEIVEIKFGYLAHRDLVQVCDKQSDDHPHLAEVLTSAWGGFGLSTGGQGPVLQRRSVWRHPRRVERGVALRVLDLLPQKLWPKKSILVLHAFRLEYYGLVPEGAASEVGYRRRLRAMKRMAERR